MPLVRSLATVQIPLVVFVIGFPMPLELFSVPLPLPARKLQADVLRIVDVSCVPCKMNAPRRSCRLVLPLQQSRLQQYIPHAFACATASRLQRFSVGTWILSGPAAPRATRASANLLVLGWTVILLAPRPATSAHRLRCCGLSGRCLWSWFCRRTVARSQIDRWCCSRAAGCSS